MSSSMSTQRFVLFCAVLYQTHPLTLSQQGDLGHTDLQEDLEFHSSSTLPRLVAYPPTSSNAVSQTLKPQTRLVASCPLATTRFFPPTMATLR